MSEEILKEALISFLKENVKLEVSDNDWDDRQAINITLTIGDEIVTDQTIRIYK